MGGIKITESSCQDSQDVVCEKYENPSVSVESSQVEQPGMDYKFFYTGLLGKFLTTIEPSKICLQSVLISHKQAYSLPLWMIHLFSQLTARSHLTLILAPWDRG